MAGMALNFFQSFRSGSGQALGGRYTLLKPLGEGGFGHTFLAKDLHLPGQPQCVIKQLKPSDRRPNQLQVARRLFDTEAQVLYHLGTHPQIPRLLAHFEDNGEFYLAQDFIDGHSMGEEFEAAPWDEAAVVAFLGDVLGILAFVHQQQVIHRDLKPANLIRRRRDKRLVMIDFGAVKQVRTQLAVNQPNTPHTVVIGTQGYMPSEQLGGQPRFSSDIYAVGVMGIQGLTGQYPETLLRSPSTGELDWHRNLQASPELVALLDTMVRYDFRARYPDAQTALRALKALPPYLSQHIPSKPAQKSDLPNAWSPEGIPEGTPEAPAAPETQQTVAVVGRSPAGAENAQVNRDRAIPAPPIRQARSSGGRWAIIVFAIAAILGIGAGLWRAFIAPPSFEQASESSDQDPSQPPEQPFSAPPGAGRADTPTPAQARAAVSEFYQRVSDQDWQGARALTAGQLAGQFDPDFFQQFRRVTVENLQVNDQGGGELTLVGENIYRYGDGTRQREARTFTVALIEGEPRIVSSAFVRVIRKRS